MSKDYWNITVPITKKNISTEGNWYQPGGPATTDFMLMNFNRGGMNYFEICRTNEIPQGEKAIIREFGIESPTYPTKLEDHSAKLEDVSFVYQSRFCILNYVKVFEWRPVNKNWRPVEVGYWPHPVIKNPDLYDTILHGRGHEKTKNEQPVPVGHKVTGPIKLIFGVAILPSDTEYAQFSLKYLSYRFSE